MQDQTLRSVQSDLHRKISLRGIEQLKAKNYSTNLAVDTFFQRNVYRDATFPVLLFSNLLLYNQPITSLTIPGCKGFENIVRKGENFGSLHFRLSLECFHSFWDTSHYWNHIWYVIILQLSSIWIGQKSLHFIVQSFIRRQNFSLFRIKNICRQRLEFGQNFRFIVYVVEIIVRKRNDASY